MSGGVGSLIQNMSVISISLTSGAYSKFKFETMFTYIKTLNMESTVFDIL